jgi:predicted permease
MNPLHTFLARLRAVFNKPALDADFAEELAQHLEAATADNLRSGLTPEEARRQAQIALGGIEQTRELHRDARGLPWLENLARDVRFAGRTLRRSPGFTAVAVFTLALGLTVNAVFFTIANDLFFRPLPAHAPDRLVVVAQKGPEINVQLPFSYPDVEDFRRLLKADPAAAPELARAFSDLMAYKEQVVHLSLAGKSTERAFVHVATENYFSLLGVQPFLGRFFLPTECRAASADPIIVLTYDAWAHRFGANPEIVGQTLKLDGVPFTVVGVAPEGFFGAAFGTALSGFVPITMLPKLSNPYDALKRGVLCAYVVGRLAPGATVAQASAAMNVAFAQVMKANPGKTLKDSRAVVMLESNSRPGPAIAHFAPTIMAALSVLALLVLVVAIANVANLLFARSSTRERELAIRSAVGARRFQLIRGLLVESTVLALAAGAVGAFASLWLPLARPSFSDFAPAAPTGTDWRPFVFTGIAALVVGIVTGLLPALKASGIAPLASLNNSGNSGTGRRHPWRSMLVVGQVAVSCVVLIGAAMALRSFVFLAHSPTGFKVENRTVASFDLGLQNYSSEQGLRFQARLLERLRALPGVESASLATSPPLDVAVNMKGAVTAAGASEEAARSAPPVACVYVEHEGLATLGMRVAAGRDFTAHDGPGAPFVIVINRALARQLFPGQNPIGRRVSVQGNEAEVIGVVGADRFYRLTSDNSPLFFGALEQDYHSNVSAIVWTRESTGSIGPDIAKVVHDLDPDLPIYRIQTLAEQVEKSPLGLMPFRIGAVVAGAQGGIALLLAGAGIFGLVAFAVTRRTREIGIRVALGASRFAVMRDVAMGSLVLVLIGLAVGVAISLAASRTLSGLLAGVGHGDGLIIGGVASLVLLTAVAACWIPARRATLINPVDALRAE